MRAHKYLDLLAVFAVTVVTASLVVAFPGWQTPIRVALGLVVVLLAPGYVLMQTLFERDDVDGVERLALTLGLSIAAVPLLGLLLNWSTVNRATSFKARSGATRAGHSGAMGKSTASRGAGRRRLGAASGA